MKQLMSEYTYNVSGVVNATPVNIMAIPFDSTDTESPIFIEISCFGTSVDPTNTQTTRFFWVLPVMYYVDSLSSSCTPEENVALPYNSTSFSMMIHSDSIANFNTLEVTPQPNLSTKQFNLILTVPDNGKSWALNVYVKVFKSI